MLVWFFSHLRLVSVCIRWKHGRVKKNIQFSVQISRLKTSRENKHSDETFFQHKKRIFSSNSWPRTCYRSSPAKKLTFWGDGFGRATATAQKNGFWVLFPCCRPSWLERRYKRRVIAPWKKINLNAQKPKRRRRGKNAHACFWGSRRVRKTVDLKIRSLFSVFGLWEKWGGSWHFKVFGVLY